MKKFVIFLLPLMMILSGFAQNDGAAAVHNSSALQEIAAIKAKGRILMIKENYQIPADHFFEKYADKFGFRQGNEMVLLNVTTAKNGNKTYRYQQQYMGVPIEDAIMLLHEKNGVVTYINGVNMADFAKPYTPIFAAEDAVALAILNAPADQYAWQVPTLENDLKETMQDKDATYYPTPKLMFFDPKHGTDVSSYRLVYEVEVFAIQPLGKQVFYIDALSGEILKQIKKNQNISVEVQAKTRYHGIQTLTVDSIAPNNFILRELTRGEGNGIYTRSLHNTGSLMELDSTAALDVTDTDNFFDTDSVANEAHYGAERTYDYYLEKFGRNSIDNNGLRLMSYVHLGTNVENACWSDGAMWYGDGRNGKQFTILSVCGHEITHGLTENTANLNYENEPGALNEAFSDIFGTMIAYDATGNLIWTIGEELGTPIRDMSNPNLYQQPDTYQGTNWMYPDDPNAAMDQGGVHYNSGVANYWFYLLSEGGSGTNDIGNAFNVHGIGTEAAEQIAFYTLTENLVPTSDYAETRELSMIVAADLYGDCSDEVYAVADAWYAVGLGRRYSDTAVYITDILSPATDCALTAEEPVTMALTYNSCEQPLAAGTTLVFNVTLDNNNTFTESVTLTEDVEPNETFEITLNHTVDVSAIGNHILDISVRPDFTDSVTSQITNYNFSNLIYQNTDVHILSITSPVSSCHLTDTTTITFTVTFDICDSIPAGTEIPIGFKINSSDTTIENFVLEQAITSQDTLTLSFSTGADFTTAARNTIYVIAANPDDLDASDNSISKVVVRPRALNEIDAITFDNDAYKQFSYSEVNEHASAAANTVSGYNGGKVWNMSGGSIIDYYSELEIPNPIFPWMANQKMDSKITFCADGSDMAQMAIQFDLKQTSGKNTYEMLLSSMGYGDMLSGFDLLGSSMMRVLVDGVQVSQNYIPSTPGNDPFATRAINLSDYLDGVHAITFESKCFSNDMNIMGMSFTLDHVYLDNVRLLESDAINENEPQLASFTIYPNPTSEQVSVQLNNCSSENVEYQLFDLFGRELSKGSIQNGLTTIDLNPFANGMYVLRLTNGNEILGTSKIVKD